VYALSKQATWDGPDDPANPYNWPTARKVSVGLVCSTSQLVTTMSASMVVPALDQVLEDVGMGTSSGQVAFSVFFLGLGFAPFLVAPLAEMYGRRRVWLAGNAVYVVWNSLCPVGFSPALMIVGRLLSGAGASVGVTVRKLALPLLSVSSSLFSL
jgi:MFS family permease